MAQYNNHPGANPYNQQAGNIAGGYGQGGPNDGGYNQGGYNQGGYNQGGYNQGGYNQGGFVEQAPAGGAYGGQGTNMEMDSGAHMAILNECRSIDAAIQELENKHQNLRALHDRAAREAGNEPDSRTNQEITAVLDEIRDSYRVLGERLRNLATKRESHSPRCKPQVDRVKRALQDSTQRFTTLQSQLSREKNADVERQYRIVNNDPPEAEVQQYMDRVRNGQADPNELFHQAIMKSSRVEGANRKLTALKERNQALQQIERQLAELLQLFVQMDTLVEQQDEAIQDIERKAEETVENLDRGNVEVATAVKSARAARKKKWICLCIAVLIVLIIIIAVVAYLAVSGNLGGGKKPPTPTNTVVVNNPTVTATATATGRG